MSDEQDRSPLPERQVIDPNYRGIEVGKPPGCRDPRNAKRVTPGPIRATLDPGAEDEFFGI